MARLLDQMIARGYHRPTHVPESHLPPRHLVDFFRDTDGRFLIDNVAEYFHYHAGKEVEEWGFGDFPNIAPPYDFYWMEYAEPRPEAKLPGRRPRRVGLLTHAVDRDRVTGWITEGVRDLDPEIRRFLDAGAHWFVLTWVFSDVDGIPKPALLAEIRYPLTHEGRLLNTRGIKEVLEFGLYIDVRDEDERMQIGTQLIRECLLPSLLATSLLHCRNVSSVAVPPPPPKLARAYKKKHRAELVTFHTLAIDPMKTVIEREGGASTEGLRRALHTVRGHFAHYGERFGRGRLFGRLEGTYWMRPHWRGDKAEGLVLKDYDVRPREEAR